VNLLGQLGHFLGRIALGAAIVAGCASAPTGRDPQSPPDPADSPSPKTTPEDELAALRERVIAAHNRIRAEHKLPALETSERLQRAAELHARDMAARQKMTHEGRNHSRPIDRIKKQGYPYRRAGENVAAGYWSIDRLMKGWMDSPPHKKNILGGFSQIGVGCATGEDGKRYWCVTFGLPIRH
jgi:uncharacterized protein YkwD